MMDQPAEHQPERQDTTPEPGRFMHAESAKAAEGSDRDLFGNAPKGYVDWSHRRGEPRVFVLLWMIYLMGSTVLMFASMSRAYSISPEIIRPAARSMLVMVVLGFSVLWALVRFSQRFDPSIRHRHVAHALRDAMVLFVPMQAVIWPQAMPMLAGWPIDVVAAISALCLAWIMILAGVIALGSASIERNNGHEFFRVLWMLIVILIVFGAPMVAAVYPMGVEFGVDRPRVGWLLSPVTGLLEIVRDRRELGMSAKVFIEHWRLIIALMCVGMALLLIARAAEVARSKYRA